MFSFILCRELSPRLRTVRTCFQELSYNSDSLPGYGPVTIKVYSDTSVDNMEHSTVNEYIFQENYQRNQNEQKLYMACQQAVSGWQNTNSEISQLKSALILSEPK
jgi:hypothetical protein